MSINGTEATPVATPTEPEVAAPVATPVDPMFAKFGIEDAKAKTSMTAMLKELQSLVGKPFTADALKSFAHQFAVKSARSTGDGKPREATKLFDKDGNMIGARCSATLVWMLGEEFTNMQSISKQGHSLKGALNTKARGVESEANALLVEARDAKTPAEKLAIFEQYDKEMLKAKEIRSKGINASEFVEGTLTFPTVEELAKHMKVEVITTQPESEDTTDAPKTEAK